MRAWAGLFESFRLLSIGSGHLTSNLFKSGRGRSLRNKPRTDPPIILIFLSMLHYLSNVTPKRVQFTNTCIEVLNALSSRQRNSDRIGTTYPYSEIRANPRPLHLLDVLEAVSANLSETRVSTCTASRTGRRESGVRVDARDTATSD